MSDGYCHWLDTELRPPWNVAEAGFRWLGQYPARGVWGRLEGRAGTTREAVVLAMCYRAGLPGDAEGAAEVETA